MSPEAIMPSCKVRQLSTPGLSGVRIEFSSWEELHLTFELLPHESLDSLAARLSSFMLERSATIVKHDIFGRLNAHAPFKKALSKAFGACDWPINWIDSKGDRAIAGMHVFAIAGLQVGTIFRDGRAVARQFNNGHARHCFFADVGAILFSGTEIMQYQKAFIGLDRLLHDAGMSMRNLVRTWFFLAEINSSYDLFNTLRTKFYGSRGLCALKGFLPSSTGIGAHN